MLPVILIASLVCVVAAVAWRTVSFLMHRLRRHPGNETALQTAARHIDPHGVHRDLAMAEAELHQNRSTVALERVLRKMITEGRAGEVIAVVRRLEPMLPMNQLTPAFAWDVSTRLAPLKPRRDARLEEALLRQAATDTAHVGARASLRLAEMGTVGEIQFHLAQDFLRPLLTRPGLGDVYSRALALADLLDVEVTSSRKSAAATTLPIPPAGPTLFVVSVESVSRDGIHVRFAQNGSALVVPFDRIDAIKWSVSSASGAPVLAVDLHVRRGTEPAPSAALRLTSEDSSVAALYPTLAPNDAWRTFLENVARVCRAPFDPPLAKLLGRDQPEEAVLDLVDPVPSAPRPSLPSRARPSA